MSKNKYLAKLKVYIYNFGQIFVFTHFLYSTPNVKKKKYFYQLLPSSNNMQNTFLLISHTQCVNIIK